MPEVFLDRRSMSTAGAASAEPAWRMVARQGWPVSVSLRPFIDDFDRLVAGVRSVLLTAPAGSSKAVIATAIVASAAAIGQRALVLAHHGEIIDQAVSTLRNIGARE
jgi:hypothetical protein